MCLIAFAIGASPERPLVIASNRDEQWLRPTEPLQSWVLPSGKMAYSGRDLQAGGTWLGLAQDGRVAMLTNVREGLPEASPRSRGELVTDWLDSDIGWQDWLDRFDPRQYGGFNLVLGDLNRGLWSWVSNRAPAASLPEEPLQVSLPGLPPGWHGHRLEPGLYGLSNAALDTPWPKTVALKQALQSHLQAGAEVNEAGLLLEALLHMPPARDEELPATGLPIEFERRLSSPFVHAPEKSYGTRSSLLVHAHGDGRLVMQEWTHHPKPSVMSSKMDSKQARWPLAHSTRRGLEISLLAS